MLHLILALYVLSLLISQTALDVLSAVLVGFLFWLGWRWKSQDSSNFLVNPNGIDWIFPVWLILIPIGFFVGPGVSDNFAMALFDMKWIVVMYFIVTAILYIQPDEKIVIPAAWTFIVLAAYSIVIYFLGFDPIRGGELSPKLADGTVQSGGLLQSPAQFAQIYGAFLTIFAGLLFYFLRWKQSGRIVLILAILVGFASVILTFNKVAILSLLVSYLVMVLFYSRRLALVVLLLISLVLGLAYEINPSIHMFLKGIVAEIQTEKIWLWKANIEMIKEQPIFGFGMGENINLLTDYYQKIGAPAAAPLRIPPNQFIHVFAGSGILGGLIYIFVVSYFLIISIKSWSRVSSRNIFQQGLSLGLIGAQVYFIVGGLFEANFEQSKIKYLMALIWASVTWLAYETKILKERI